MKVLLIEDEPDLRRVVARVLAEEGYAVDSAANGEEGLAKAQLGDYDAIVLDLMLPRVNGWDLLRELRRRKATPVLIVTARDTLQDRVLGLDIGGDDYLVKPFELKELQARLRALIRRASGKTQALIEICDVVIDTAARTVVRAGSPVSLTAREYALVEYLALHRKQLVTRAMIYDRLFDDNEDTLSNLIEVYISNLRKKLGKEFIVTRRGQGYMIDA
ncbi:MAG TPA: response regulator transcription factor [Pirellulales bacterium]|jgi:two-component system OmpR family response regulator|nr:response regulator transcription factor [Pirellulales bacterium]